MAVSAVKTGYVNPLTMMNQKKNNLTGPEKIAAEKKQEEQNDVQKLQGEQLSLQSEILMMKGTSNGSALSSDTQEAVEQRLEEITSQLRTAKSQEVSLSTPSASAEEAKFDMYIKSAKTQEEPGIYQLKQNEDGYQVVFKEYEENSLTGLHSGTYSGALR